MFYTRDRDILTASLELESDIGCQISEPAPCRYEVSRYGARFSDIEPIFLVLNDRDFRFSLVKP